MSMHATRRLSWSAWGCSTLLLLAAFWLTVSHGGGLGWIVLFGLVQLVFASTGTVLTLRVGKNPIGWLFLGFGVLASVAIMGEAYSLRALQPSPNSLPGGTAALVVSSVIYGPGLFAVVLALLMLFPDGHLPSRRWRPAARITIFAGFMFTALQAVSPGSMNSLDPAQTVDSPIVLGGAAGVAGSYVIALCAVTVLSVFAASFVSLMRRFGQATGVLRQQLKWFVGAAALFIATVACQLVLWNISATWTNAGVLILFGVGATALPIATGIAILRYRLYEIDVIIRKTLIYAALAATLALLYLGGISLTTWVFRSVTGQSSALAVTLSTLAVAAAFQPLRTRIQRTVDHRFYRRKYDATRTLEAFNGRLREQIDLDALNTEVLGVVTETLQPSHAALWLATGAQAEIPIAGPSLTSPWRSAATSRRRPPKSARQEPSVTFGERLVETMETCNLMPS